MPGKEMAKNAGEPLRGPLAAGGEPYRVFCPMLILDEDRILKTTSAEFHAVSPFVIKAKTRGRILALRVARLFCACAFSEQGKAHQFGHTADAQLLHQAAAMFFNRLDAQAQLAGHNFVCITRDD
jgi:hypothetical protein